MNDEPRPAGPTGMVWVGAVEPSRDQLQRGDVWDSPDGLRVWDGEEWIPSANL